RQEARDGEPEGDAAALLGNRSVRECPRRRRRTGGGHRLFDKSRREGRARAQLGEGNFTDAPGRSLLPAVGGRASRAVGCALDTVRAALQALLREREREREARLA